MDNKLFYQHFGDCWIQTFDDQKLGRKFLTKQFIMSDIQKHKAELVEMNKQWAWVFIQPNPWEWRKRDDITDIRWVYIDMDEWSKTEMFALIETSPIYPSMIVESSRSYHLYWRCDMKSEDEFNDLVQWLIWFYNGDPAISSVNEVLRAPWFFHMKNATKPFKIQLVHYSDDKYEYDDMLSTYKQYAKEQDKHSVSIVHHDDVIDKIRNINILSVLDKLSVPISRSNFIVGADWKETSASINIKWNYINRFSWQNGSGSTIDAAMVYGNMTKPEAIEWLKREFWIHQDNNKKIDMTKIEKKKYSSMILDKKREVNKRTWCLDSLWHVFGKPRDDDYIFIVWAPWTGKTTFALNMAVANANKWLKVAFFSMEMSEESLVTRYALTQAWVHESVLEQNAMTDSQRRIIENAAEELSNDNLYIVDSSIWKIDIDSILATATDFDMIFLDNFWFLAKWWMKEHEEQEIISRKILCFIAQHNCTVIMLHHYSKWDARSKTKTMRGSQKLYDDSTKIVELSRNMDWDWEDWSMFFKMSKNRYAISGWTWRKQIVYRWGKYYDAQPSWLTADFAKEMLK